MMLTNCIRTGDTMKKLIILCLLIISQSALAQTLDRITAVMNDKVITLSKVKRVNANLTARRDIAPQIYEKEKYTTEELSRVLLQRQLIRARLDEMGYLITDEQVESQINATERRLGLTRRDLLNFLDGNNTTFDEYFEVIRETIEFNLFFSRIIQPLINITEQEIKNAFYQENRDNRTLSFKYTLVDFSLHKRYMTKDMLERYKSSLENFQTTGILPQELSELDTNILGEITEDGLNNELKRVLHSTNEGDFSDPILIGDYYKSFYVRSKDLVESDFFLRSKDRINAQLYERRAKEAIELWYEREEARHYVRYF